MRFFFYGTLKTKETREMFCADAKLVKKNARLNGFKIYDLGSYPCIVPSTKEGAYCIGDIYDISPTDVRRLDFYEGYPRLYDKQHIDGIGWVYFMHSVPSHAEPLPDHTWR